ncbi:MAG: hypothetical protein II944_02305 [Ruminobacter sp.]|nr:hypothetical protein [Ruminobacter sp.]
MEKKFFKGSIVIGDPGYFIKSDEDWEKCKFGKELSALGFTDFLLIEFPDDPQVVIDTDTQKVLGGICQDSCELVIVYKEELEKYNPDYEADFFDKSNRTIIDDFTGYIEHKVVPVTIDGDNYEDTVITGTGNINFRSCYEEDLSV